MHERIMQTVDFDSEPFAGFSGDREDLKRFLLLCSSCIRSDERERELQAWTEYKLARQRRFVAGESSKGSGKQGLWGKGDYIRSLTAPAIDLRGATLTDVCLGYVDLRGARMDGCRFVTRNLSWFALKGALLEYASLRNASMSGARMMEADLRHADMSGVDLSGADLSQANLAGANLGGADLRGANLECANLVGANLVGTNLCGCRVYGVSAWDVTMDDDESLRRDLIVTPTGQADVHVDNIEVAQFVYLLLNNPKIRGVIDTVCRKGVLILGRFTAERKVVLDSLRTELRSRGFVPMLFDFEKPSERDVTETVRTLAGLSRFVIADITNPKSSPLELQATIPDLMIPFVPIIAKGEHPFSMFSDLRRKYHWVLDPLEYRSAEELIRVIEPAIIRPALEMHSQLLVKRAEGLQTRSADDF